MAWLVWLGPSLLTTPSLVAGPWQEGKQITLWCLNKQSFVPKQRLMYFIVQCHVYSGLVEGKM